MQVIWMRDLDGYYSSAVGCSGMRVHIVAEMLPDAGWDWVAWSNDGSGRLLTGRSETRMGALRQAEQAGLVLAGETAACAAA